MSSSGNRDARPGGRLPGRIRRYRATPSDTLTERVLRMGAFKTLGARH
jgi:hypothetical protein